VKHALKVIRNKESISACVVGMAENRGASPASLIRGSIRRTVVHDDDFERRVEFSEALNQRADGFGFVESGDYHRYIIVDHQLFSGRFSHSHIIIQQ
jgi:hypothetical protein